MNQIKASVRSLALVVCMVATLFVGSAPASATSIYDDYIEVSPSLEVSFKWQSQDCTQDLSYGWDEAFLSTSTNSTFKNSFLEARENGMWGVSQLINGYGGLESVYPTDYPVYSNSAYKHHNILIYWVEDYANASLTWSDGWVRANKASAVWEVQLTLAETCNLSVAHVHAGNSSNALVGGHGQAFPYSTTFDRDYPAGYEGALIPYVPFDPPPYYGTVDCFGEDPLHMMIYQAGNDGPATLTYESSGRATWEYGLLPDTPYAIVVDCDGTLANSDGTVIPSSTSGDWVCDPYTVQYDQPYCVLS